MPLSKWESLKAQADEAMGFSGGQAIREGVRKVGEENTPNFLKKFALAVPIIGGFISVINAISTNSPEIACLSCAGSLGIISIILGISKIPKKNQ